MFITLRSVVRNSRNNWKRKNWILVLVLLFSAATAQAQCAEVDLQAVSIDPGLPTIGKGQTTSITVVMKNNSACAIPLGEATAQVTLSSVYLDLGNPINFHDICGQWTYLGAISNNKQHNLFFRNNGGPIPPGGKFCSFHFDVKGKTITPFAVAVTLASSLSGDAKTADVDGTNQSSATEIHIKSAATPVIAAVPVLADFRVTASECNAMLNWQTVANSAVDSFEVEYGTDGSQFSKVGSVAGKPVPAGSVYEYVRDQGNGRGYYRLKILEKAGKYTYSKIISVDTKCIIKKGFLP